MDAGPPARPLGNLVSGVSQLSVSVPLTRPPGGCQPPGVSGRSIAPVAIIEAKDVVSLGRRTRDAESPGGAAEGLTGRRDARDVPRWAPARAVHANHPVGATEL